MTLVYLLVCAIELKQGGQTVLNQYALNPSQVETLNRCDTDMECDASYRMACVSRGHRNQAALTGWLETRPAQGGAL